MVLAGFHGVGGVFVDAELSEAGEEVVELVSAEHPEHKGCGGVLAVRAKSRKLQGVANRQVGVVGDLALFDEGLVPIGDLHGSPALGWGVGGCYNIFWRGGGEGSYGCCLYGDVCATVDCIFCANRFTYPPPTLILRRGSARAAPAPPTKFMQRFCRGRGDGFTPQRIFDPLSEFSVTPGQGRDAQPILLLRRLDSAHATAHLRQGERNAPPVRIHSGSGAGMTEMCGD